MKKAGIDFWAITTGNEPLNGNIFAPAVGILSLGWTAELQVEYSSLDIKVIIYKTQFFLGKMGRGELGPKNA